VTGAADSGRTRALLAGLAGAGVLAGAGGAVAMRRRRGQFIGPVMSSEAAAAPGDTVQPSAGVDDRAELAARRTSDLLTRFRARPGDGAAVPGLPNQAEPYATLGHPPAAGADTASDEPAAPGRDVGDET